MEPKCANHPDKTAHTECSRCGKSFCKDCLTHLKGRFLCQPCLDIEVKFEETRDDREKFQPASAKVFGWGCAVIILLLFLGIAAALILPYFRLQKSIACQKNLRHIHRTLLLYAGDYGGKFPPTNNDLTPLVKWRSSKVRLQNFICPATRNTVRTLVDLADNSASTSSNGMSYYYRGGLSFSSKGETVPKIPLMWDQSIDNHHKFINVLYLNGAIESLEKDFPQLK